MDARKAFVVETFSHLDGGSVMQRTTRETDGFEDDVVGGHPELRELVRVELLVDLTDAFVIAVLRRCQRKEEVSTKIISYQGTRRGPERCERLRGRP